RRESPGCGGPAGERPARKIAPRRRIEALERELGLEAPALAQVELALPGQLAAAGARAQLTHREALSLALGGEGELGTVARQPPGEALALAPGPRAQGAVERRAPQASVERRKIERVRREVELDAGGLERAPAGEAAARAEPDREGVELRAREIGRHARAERFDGK